MSTPLAHLRQPVEGLEALGDDVPVGERSCRRGRVSRSGTAAPGNPDRPAGNPSPCSRRRALGVSAVTNRTGADFPGEAGGNQSQAAADQLAGSFSLPAGKAGISLAHRGLFTVDVGFDMGPRLTFLGTQFELFRLHIRAGAHQQLPVILGMRT